MISVWMDLNLNLHLVLLILLLLMLLLFCHKALYILSGNGSEKDTLASGNVLCQNCTNITVIIMEFTANV